MCAKAHMGIRPVCEAFACNECDYNVGTTVALRNHMTTIDLAFHIAVLCVGCSVVVCMIKDITEGYIHTLGSGSECVKCAIQGNS